ncbi:MAG: hypothetical protein AAFV25_07735, partial [Bacteroidota bacterium]
MSVCCVMLLVGFVHGQCPQIQNTTINPANCSTGCDLCPDDQITLNVQGVNLPNNGTIDWYYDTSPSFDPYSGQGIPIGNSPITTAWPAACTNCPNLNLVMIDGCGVPEPAGEFVIFNSGSGFDPFDFQLDYDPNNNAGGGVNADVNVPVGTGCFAIPGPASLSGCGCVIPVGPGDFVPPGATVIFFTSAFNNSGAYDFSAICTAGQPVYTMQSSCNRTFGAFSNAGSTGPRNYSLGLSCGCSSAFGYSTDDPAFEALPADGVYLAGTFGQSPSCAIPSIFGGGGLIPSTVAPFTYTIPANFCNTGPFYIKGVLNPPPVSCCQTETQTFRINVNCPAGIPTQVEACDDGTGQGTFNLQAVNNIVNGGSGLIVNWYVDALASIPIFTPAAYTTNANFVYAVVGGGLGSCPSSPVQIPLILRPAPEIINPIFVEICGEYVFPPVMGTNLSNPAYFTGPMGTGIRYQPGQRLQGPLSNVTIYIRDDNGFCSDEEQFILNITPRPDIMGSFLPIRACESYELPPIMGTNLTGNQAYYDQPGGLGNVYPVGFEITSSIVLYMYDGDLQCNDDERLDIRIFERPQFDESIPLTACEAFVLPAITGSNLSGLESYYNQPGANGDRLFPGDTISRDTVLYLIDNNGGVCLNEDTLQITFTDPPAIDSPGNLSTCDSIALPTISGTDLSGNVAYYDQPGGNGTQLAVGTFITSQDTLYIYDSTGNCVDEVEFIVSISPEPQIAPQADLNACDSVALPAISGTNISTDAAYYDQPGGMGNRLTAGTFVRASGTYYIYDGSGNCTDEESFSISIGNSVDAGQDNVRIVCGGGTFDLEQALLG